MTMNRIGVLGGGAWGTALALACRRAGRDVVLWAHEKETVDAINTRRLNPQFLPNLPLDPAFPATRDPAAFHDRDLLLLVTPAQHARRVLMDFAPHLLPRVPVIIAAKGIEQGSLALLSEVVMAAAPLHPVAALSGPSFAAEVARGLPTALTLAAEDHALAQKMAQAIASPALRPYVSTDVRGTLLGGALKNVIAIAAGITVGRKLGDNARAAVVTRGLSELAGLAVAMGARAETLVGLSGLGDLVLTCLGDQSRNLSLGRELGEGRPLADILASRASVAEGAHTAAAAAQLADRHGVDAPILRAVDAVLRGADVQRVIEELLARPLRDEGRKLGAA